MDHVEYDNCIDTRNKKLDKRFEKRTRYIKIEPESKYIGFHLPHEKDACKISIPDDAKHSAKVKTEKVRLHGCWDNSIHKRTIYDFHHLEYMMARPSQKSKTSVVKTTRLHRVDGQYILEEIEKPLFKEVTRSNKIMFKLMRSANFDKKERDKAGTDETKDIDDYLYDDP
jgi:hypothetical protein